MTGPGRVRGRGGRRARGGRGRAAAAGGGGGTRRAGGGRRARGRRARGPFLPSRHPGSARQRLWLGSPGLTPPFLPSRHPGSVGHGIWARNERIEPNISVGERGSVRQRAASHAKVCLVDHPCRSGRKASLRHEIRGPAPCRADPTSRPLHRSPIPATRLPDPAFRRRGRAPRWRRHIRGPVRREDPQRRQSQRTR